MIIQSPIILNYHSTLNYDDCDLLDINKKRLQPEQRLVFAILWRALKDVSDYERHIRRDAFQYLYSDNTDPFSFLWCCHVLDLNPNKIQTQSKDYLYKISSSMN